MSDLQASRLTAQELQAESGTLLPNKEVLSLLDLLVDLDVALDLAAPIDLAIAANANIAAPINAAVGANVLSALSNAAAVGDQSVTLDQGITGEAIANAPQTSVIDQSNDVIDDGTDAGTTDDSVIPLPDTGGLPTTDDVGSLLDGDLLNVEVNAAVDADLAAPVAGAVAANANAAAPINASVAANVASIGSEAVSVATQDAAISQNLDGVVAEATADQDSTITQ
jgi:hypothetical protein